MSRATTLYRKVAGEFAERLVRELNGEVQAIVLYGSVAREQATAKSDIDIFIVSPHKDSIRFKVAEIEEDLDSESNYRTLLTSVFFAIEEVEYLAKIGSPFMSDVITEGVVLYDDGSFSRLRQEVLGGGRGDVGRRKVHAPERAL